MEQVTSIVDRWNSGDDTSPNPNAIYMQTSNSQLPNPETEAEEL